MHGCVALLAFLQRGEDFVEEGDFRSGGGFHGGEEFSQPISQLLNGRTGAAKWHSCAKGWFRSCETPFEIGARLRNKKISALALRAHFCCEIS